MAMRAATFADRVGLGREFALCALRRAFRRGEDLGTPAAVLAAADEAGLEPEVVREATQAREIKLALREATEAAHELGVFGVPTILAAGEVFWGDDRVEDAAARLSRAP